MNIFLKVILAVACLSCIMACGQGKGSTSKNGEPKNAEGYIQQANFTTLEGDTVKVSDFKGKVVMIDFWETWCKPCIGSFPGLNKLQKEYKNDFVILSVTPGFTDTEKDVKAFADDHEYSFTYLMDSNDLHQKLNVNSIPFKIFIDTDGNLIKTSLGSAGPEEDYNKGKEIIEKYKKGSSKQDAMDS